MSRLARILKKRYEQGCITLDAVFDAWDYLYIDRDEVGAIIGEAS